MASNPGDFAGLLPSATRASESLSEAIAELAEQLRRLPADRETSSAPVRSSGSGSGPSLGNTLLDVFGSGLGLSPLISGIASLFGGGGDSANPAPLARFALPPAIQVNAGVSENGGPAFAVDYPQGGIFRPVSWPAQPAAQITVQVQAMDSRSFLDHSSEIAMAVRQAMLESSVLNDVVREA